MAKRKPRIRIKSDQEIEKMRMIGALTSEVLQELAAAVKPGITTGALDELAGKLMAEKGCKSASLGYRGFPSHTCLSVNEGVVHGIGGPYELREGDVLKVDVCCVSKDGWYGDNAVTVPVGEVSEQDKRLMAVTEQAFYEALKYAVAGNRLSKISATIEDFVKKHGFSIVREFVGHGIGRQLHEEPQVANYRTRGASPKLEPGMVLCIEPMVNSGRPAIRILDDGWTVVTRDGGNSAHFEHTVLITEGEPELLTNRPRTATTELLGIAPLA